MFASTRMTGLVLALLLICSFALAKQGRTTATYDELPLPSSLPLQDYETRLYTWLINRRYQTKGWARDTQVRDTGPFINTQYYGTHPAVRIYYSPEVINWLRDDRKGVIPDGAMIIKEMFNPPAAPYVQMANNPNYRNPDKYQKFLDSMVFSWTVMVRDSSASKDGWFWANPGAPDKGESIADAVEKQLDKLDGPPGSMFGAPCLRCHASAASEFTFADLRNVEGFAADANPLKFLVDTSWRSQDHFEHFPLSQIKDDPWVQSHFMLNPLLRPYSPASAMNRKPKDKQKAAHSPPLQLAPAAPEALSDPNPEFISFFGNIWSGRENQVLAFPSQWQDQVLPESHTTRGYLTSNNCFACHGGLGGQPSGVTMFIQTGEGYGTGINVSEYGEWRWSPMGLAGRDPVFHAQLESEMAYLERDAELKPTPLVGSLDANRHAVTNTCLSCHGAMGQRQLTIDAATNADLDANFSTDYFYLQPRLKNEPTPEPTPDYLKYGQLARDGISCAICHQIDQPSDAKITDWTPPTGWVAGAEVKSLAYMLFHNNTGKFERGPTDSLFGPFENVATEPMKRSLGLTPTHNAYTSDSQLCGTCHTINLPNIGASVVSSPVLDAAETNPVFKDYPHSIEQATFLEWQNSAFALDKGKPGSRFQSCQDCHMPGGYQSSDKAIDVQQITTQIAAIQDTALPEADNRLGDTELDIPLRDDYKRHEHVGLNVFLLEMFDQFPDILGVDKNDYMTGAKNGVDIAIDNMVRQAREATATITVKANWVGDELLADVNIRNFTGHRLPSGVAFRRLFVELLVFDGDEVIWGSGRTNKVGVIVDGEGVPLGTEFLEGQAFQPHHQVISNEQQVQIYEELHQNAQGEFTTSFVHRVHDIKDNRLLPDGWRKSTFFKPQGEILQQFMQATDPHAVELDPEYQDDGPGFKGGDALQYQIALPAGTKPEKLRVQATLYSQSIPPSWLRQRFNAAPDKPATQRLFYLASHLNVEGTAIEDWKLKLVSDEVSIH